jgi:hypothetical protein
MSSIPWDTSGTTLKYIDGSYYQLRGFSLTSTEYHSAEFNNTGWYDFGWYVYNTGTGYTTVYANQTSSSNGNPGLTLNVYYLMQNIFLNLNPTTIGNGTIENPYVAPMIRIPLCADLWLNGSSQQTTISSYSSPYFYQGQSNVNFTGAQYQQAITDLIYYCYQTWNNTYPNTPITFSLDLHWNYASPVPLTSKSYQTTQNSSSPPSSSSAPPNPNPNYSISNSSSEQLPLCGVCTSDNLGLTDNTQSFWTSVASQFGVTISGGLIGSPAAYTYTSDPSGTVFTRSSSTTNAYWNLIAPNIFFELYNEPYTDAVTATTTYADNYSIYINGGSGISFNGQTYSFTGMLTIYNLIRSTVGAQNIQIIAGSDSYAFMNFNTSISSSQWDTTNNSIVNTYNCFTTLRDNIGSANFYNVMLNLHPYVGLYSGALKHPGYYDSSYYNATTNSTTSTTVPIPGFGQIVSALQNPSLTNFYMNCPIICTEFGQYDLPFSTYSTNNTQPLQASQFTYPSSYISAPVSSPSLYYFLGSNNYSTPYYNGNYIDASGNTIFVPGIIGYLMDFKSLNVSFCAWAIRPNSGGCGQIYANNSSFCSQNYLIGTDNQYYYSWNPDYNAWAAFQPDVTTGSWCSYPQQPTSGSIWDTTPTNLIPPSVPNPNALPVSPTSTSPSPFSLQLISSTNQNISTSTYNYGCQGADFEFIFNNYYII